jgi:hypothetical protein
MNLLLEKSTPASIIGGIYNRRRMERRLEDR